MTENPAERSAEVGGVCSRRIYSPCPDFRLEKSEGIGPVFFVHASGARVATDEFGAKIWEALPGTPAEIAARLSSSIDVPAEMLRDFLNVMVRAEIAVELSAHVPPPIAASVSTPTPALTSVSAPASTRASVPISAALPAPPSASAPSLAPTLDSTLASAPTAPASTWISSPAPSASPISSLPPSALSVVIVTLNGKAHIRECLASLRAQTVGPLDIHVVDNGSTDGTLDIIRAEFPEVKLHALARNLFYPGSVNYGIAHSAGASILVLNDDVELTPGFIAEMIRVQNMHPRAAAVVPMMMLFYLRGFVNGIGNHVRTKGWGSDNFVGYVDIGQFESVTEVPSACVSAALLRRSAIEAVGPFDAAYRAYYEDADWSFRVRRAGWTINAAPRALVYHKFSAFWKNMERKLKLAARNRLRFVLKNFDGRLRRAFLRSYFKEDLINILSLVRRKRYSEAAAYVRAYGSLVLTLPDILDKRAAAKKTWAGAGPAGKVEAILKLNPEQWSGMNTENVPRLDTGIYFGYYAARFAELKRKS